MRLFCYILFFLYVNNVWGQLLPKLPATALNKVTLYPDSSFFQHSAIVYEEGDLFEVLGETRYEQEDAAQNQKFKWYFVRTPDNQTGWIYGDGLAVLQPLDEINAPLSNYYKKEITYSNKEEKIITWIAAIEGKDNFHEEDHLNPLYKEQYLVLTSPLKKSAHIQLSGQSAMGTHSLKQLRLTDINEDGVAEIILESSSIDHNSDLEGRLLEVFAFQAGTITKVFEDRLTLTYQGNQPSPALFKQVEIGAQTIRTAYVDYVACSQYSSTFSTNEVSKTQERCMEYVTYTHLWDETVKNYQPFYQESRTHLTGMVQAEKGYALRREPSYLAEVVEQLSDKTPLILIKHYEKTIKRKGQKVAVPYLYVKTQNDNYGYIHADKVKFQEIEQADLLNSYYQNPPLLKADWTSGESAVFFQKDMIPLVTKKQ